MSEELTWGFRLATAFLLTLVAMGISFTHRLNLEKEMLIAVVRAFIQLTLIGYIIKLIFDANHPLLIITIIIFMTIIAGSTAGHPRKRIPNGRFIAIAAIGFAALSTLTIMFLLQIFPVKPQYIIPISGMIIGNSMIVTSLVMTRLKSDLKLQRQLVETALALGATRRQAAQDVIKAALKAGMTPILENTKTVGLISLPGAMTGMILAGASPIEAVKIQIIVMYMLITAAALSGLGSVFLVYKQFFTQFDQLNIN